VKRLLLEHQNPPSTNTIHTLRREISSVGHSESVNPVLKMRYVSLYFSISFRSQSYLHNLLIDQLHRPYCHPYGNRRLMHCIPHSLLDGDPYADPSEIASEAVESDHHPNHHNATSSQQDGEIGAGNAPHVIGHPGGKNDWSSKGGEIPAWESCGKVVIIERAEYGEFVVSLKPLLLCHVSGSHLTPRCLVAIPLVTDDQRVVSHRLPFHPATACQQTSGCPVPSLGCKDWHWWKCRLSRVGRMRN